ncbi:MAG: ABC transporter ATP-binding protein, partial [Lapillicoccus sp.]
DLRNQAQILALIRSLVAEGLAVLLTTHHPDHALQVCDRVVLMHGTTDVRCGPAADLLKEAGLSALYGVPVRRVEVPGESGKRGGRAALVTGYVVPVEGGPALSPAPWPGRSARARR